MERMQRVLDASISVIGEERSLYDLAHNFLDMGRYSQAKKLFDTPGLRYNHDKTDLIMGSLQKRGLYEAMEQMVRQTSQLFACDRNFMYSRLLSACRDDADRATEAWVMMQEEGHSPSNRLRNQMAAIMQKAGREVPFEHKMPQRKTKATDGSTEAKASEPDSSS